MKCSTAPGAQMKILFAWVGNKDLQAARGELSGQLGAIGRETCIRLLHVDMVNNY